MPSPSSEPEPSPKQVAHALPPTLGKEPYRLFNLDVFEYELDHPMTVYGSVPFLHAHGDGGSYGALWLNPSETFVDLGCPEASKAGGEASAGVRAAGVCSHWFSASGALTLTLTLTPTLTPTRQQQGRRVLPLVERSGHGGGLPVRRRDASRRHPPACRAHGRDAAAAPLRARLPPVPVALTS